MEIKRRGGTRPGAGRKPKPRDIGAKQGADNWFHEEIGVTGETKLIPRWQKFLLNLERLADGIFKSDESDESKKIYWIAPDRAANQYLIDRMFGKPIEQQEHSGKGGGPIPISWMESKSPTNPKSGRKPSTKVSNAG